MPLAEMMQIASHACVEIEEVRSQPIVQAGDTQLAAAGLFRHLEA